MTSPDSRPAEGHRVDSSDGEYTIVTYGLGGNNGSETYHHPLGDISAGGQIDFKVQALTGYSTRISRGLYSSQFGEAYYYVFTVVETSDWSNTQTISIPDGSVSTSTPNPTSSQSNNSTNFS